MEHKEYWAEIRNDYEDEGLRYIDAWTTDDDEEEGEVIAVVDMYSGRVIYHDPRARIDTVAQQVISSVVEEAKENHPISMEKLEELLFHMIKLHFNNNKESAETWLKQFGLADDEMRFFKLKGKQEE
ncbi:MAG: hypothetical protein ACI4HI_18595 [Lachnospiraceae bacterium]